jgi:thymidine phosphorylase
MTGSELISSSQCLSANAHSGGVVPQVVQIIVTPGVAAPGRGLAGKHVGR